LLDIVVFHVFDLEKAHVGALITFFYAARRVGTFARQASASRMSSARVMGRGSSSERARDTARRDCVVDACRQDVKGRAPVQ